MNEHYTYSTVHTTYIFYLHTYLLDNSNYWILSWTSYLLESMCNLWCAKGAVPVRRANVYTKPVCGELCAHIAICSPSESALVLHEDRRGVACHLDRRPPGAPRHEGTHREMIFLDLTRKQHLLSDHIVVLHFSVCKEYITKVFGNYA